MTPRPIHVRLLGFAIAACLGGGVVGVSSVGDKTKPVRVVASGSDVGASVDLNVDLDVDGLLPTTTSVTGPTVTLPPITVPHVTIPTKTLTSVVSNLLPLEHCKDDGQPDRYGLWLADVDRHSLCQLVDDKVIGTLTFSPDGRRVAFTAQDGNVGDGSIPSHLYVIGTDGKGLVQLDPTANQPRQPSWSPDGRWLAYTRWPVDNNGDSAIMLLEWATGETREIGRIDQGSTKLEWSPDSHHIAVTEFNRRDVLTVTIPGAVSTGDTFPYLCNWSPDGHHLVVSGERGLVVVTDASGSNPRTLVADGRFARWSPSGDTISVWRDFSSWVVNSDGSGLRQVQANASPIDWSGDGEFLATSSGTIAVDAVNMSNGDVTPLARGTTAYEVIPAGWSWTGHTLAVVVERSGAYRY